MLLINDPLRIQNNEGHETLHFIFMLFNKAYIKLKINKKDNKCRRLDRMTGSKLVEPGLCHILFVCYKNISLILGGMRLIIS